MDDLAFSLTPSGGTKPPMLFRGSTTSTSGSSSGAPRLPSIRRPGSRSKTTQADQASANEDATPVARLKAGYGTPNAPPPSMPSALDRQTSCESEGGPQKSIEQLEATNARLRARCEQQEKTLVAMGKQLSALRSGKADPTEQKPVAVEAEEKPPPRNPPAAWSADVVDGCTQTEDDLLERCQIQSEQLDAMYEAAGAKNREVYHLQDTIRSLQKDVLAHQTLAEQFREQVTELEASLTESIQMRHRAEEERTILEWQLRTAKSVGGGGGGGTKKFKGSFHTTDRSTGCPSTPGSRMFTEPPSMQSTHTGLPQHDGCNDPDNIVPQDVSAAAARAAARMAKWAEKSDDGSGDDESSTSQILETSLGVSDDED